MFKFIHCADLHLGATFKSLTAKCDAMLKKIIADSSFESWNKLIDKAIAEKVDFVIISGDIFDSAKPMLRSRMIFKHGVNELIQAGIKVFIVNGNHDDKLTIFNEFSFGEQVKVFSADKVEVCELPELKVAVAGISYDNDNARENLSLAFKGLSLPEDYFKIAVLHANIGGVKNLADEESGCYSNCQLSDLTIQKFDYWALGHIHNGGVLHKEKPLVVYPGSLQGLNINQDTPKGAYLVAVNSNNEAELTFFECGELGFCRKEVDLSEVANDHDFIEKITVLRDDLLKVYKNNKLIFTELIFTGRSKFYSKLRSES